MNFAGDFEDRLETDAFLSNVTLRKCLCALTSGTDGINIRLRKTILVGVYHYPVLIHAEMQERRFRSNIGDSVLVIFSILGQFIDKAGVFGVKIGGKTIAQMSALGQGLEHVLQPYILKLGVIFKGVHTFWLKHLAYGVRYQVLVVHEAVLA